MCVLLSFIIQIQNEFKVEKLFFSETEANKEYVISAQEFICSSVSNNTLYVCNVYAFRTTYIAFTLRCSVSHRRIISHNELYMYGKE